jgi:uncharacterized membrane protein (DUF2068 family)
MDWSLLGCGAKGHVTFAPDEPGLRDRLTTTTRDGTGWRCLRCGTFVIGPPTVTGPVAAVPRVRRADELRSAFILRIFAVERFLRALVFAALAIVVWRFSASRLSLEEAYQRDLPAVRALLRDLGFSVNHNRLLGLIQHTFTLTTRDLEWLAIGVAAYAVIEVIEGTGLWLLKRWGEYFAMVATSIFLPYEIYDLTGKVTVLRLVAFVVNVALVLYLVLTKRLFGVRGGKKAYEARLRSESILEAEISALAAEQPGAGPAGAKAPAEPAGAGHAEPADEAERAGETEPTGEAEPHAPGRAGERGIVRACDSGSRNQHGLEVRHDHSGPPRGLPRPAWPVSARSLPRRSGPLPLRRPGGLRGRCQAGLHQRIRLPRPRATYSPAPRHRQVRLVGAHRAGALRGADRPPGLQPSPGDAWAQPLPALASGAYAVEARATSSSAAAKGSRSPAATRAASSSSRESPGRPPTR